MDMRAIKLFMALTLSAMLSASCSVMDPIYDTPHPNHGTVTLTTDWTARTEGIDIPSAYTVKIGDYSASLTGETNKLDHMFVAGSHRMGVYNEADNIALTGTTVTADYSGTPGWFFSAAQDIEVEKDVNHEFTAVMEQQVRQLTFVIELSGGTTDRIESVTATLSGVAGTLDFDSGAHASPTTVGLSFSKLTSGSDAGKWSATIRLLGIADGGQRLTGTISFLDGSPEALTFDTDTSGNLVNFNADKKTPLKLSGTVVETPTGTGFTAAITGWNEVSGGPVTAD